MTLETMTISVEAVAKLEELRKSFKEEVGGYIAQTSSVNYFTGALDLYKTARAVKKELGEKPQSYELTELLSRIIEKGYEFSVLDKEFASFRDDELDCLKKELTKF